MKVRKTAFALLLLLTVTGLLGENKGKVIAAVTNEENIFSKQSTQFINGDNGESYILLNRPKDKDKKEYINAYFLYDENGVYVDGTDSVPLQFFKDNQGYISLLFHYDYGCNGFNKITPVQVSDLGPINFTLTEDQIHWSVITDKGVYGITHEELTDSTYIRELLPETFNGLKGFLTVQKSRNLPLSGTIDMVPFDTHTQNISGLNDYIKASDLLYNKGLYQYIMESPEEDAKLVVTANYYFKLTLSKELFGYADSTCSGTLCKDIEVEGKLTFTKDYIIKK